MRYEVEIRELLSLSARLGCDPLLVQASSGNTSIKLGDTLWIKASGRWLAHATKQEILVPVVLPELRKNLSAGDALSCTGAWVNGSYQRASIETAMHAVLPQAVVIHVHSVNTISWAVRLDGPDRLAERLAGLSWCWIPYVASGLPLARMIERALEVNPTASVFVLANHGLVVCGETCDAAEHLLGEVDRRLAAPVRANHNLSLDAVSQRILEGGILYPCQAIFLGTAVGSMAGCRFLLEAAKELTASQSSVLRGLLEVVRRIDADAPIRYLCNPEVLALLNEDAHGYLLCTEKNAVPEQSSGQALL